MPIDVVRAVSIDLLDFLNDDDDGHDDDPMDEDTDPGRPEP